MSSVIPSHPDPAPGTTTTGATTTSATGVSPGATGVPPPVPDAATTAERHSRDGRPNPMARGLIEGLACLAIAVLTLRTFFVEGYMISTGSMAPALLGYHKRIVCPACGQHFPRGVAFDDSFSSHDVDASRIGAGRNAVCPNCGQADIAISQVPRNHGDQLLVFKQAFQFRSPRRWEIAVFHNPIHPRQAFVKRIAGLPGEEIQIIDGDVYASGTICRKPLDIQRAMRIPVFDASHIPKTRSPACSRWHRGAGWTTGGSPGNFEYQPSEALGKQGEGGWSWLGYRHGSAGSEERVSSIALSGLPLGFELPHTPLPPPVTFRADPQTGGAGTLSVRGPLSGEWEKRLRDLSTDENFQSAIDRLAARSRHPGITDNYGYNDLREGGRNEMTDLMVAGTIQLSGTGRFAVEMRDDQQRFRLLIDTASVTLSLIRAESGEVLREAPLPAALAEGRGVRLEMSVMDRQVLVAIDGAQPFPPWTYNAAAPLPPDGDSPVRWGAQDVAAEVGDPIVYRDVYYTPGQRRNGIASPFPLDEDDYFMLGDNSPVSLDSRSWRNGAVDARLLVGKPFVVHLPSRPATFRIGSRQFTVRIPDFGRMRYIE